MFCRFTYSDCCSFNFISASVKRLYLMVYLLTLARLFSSVYFLIYCPTFSGILFGLPRLQRTEDSLFLQEFVSCGEFSISGMPFYSQEKTCSNFWFGFQFSYFPTSDARVQISAQSCAAVWVLEEVFRSLKGIVRDLKTQQRYTPWHDLKHELRVVNRSCPSTR